MQAFGGSGRLPVLRAGLAMVLLNSAVPGLGQQVPPLSSSVAHHETSDVVVTAIPKGPFPVLTRPSSMFAREAALGQQAAANAAFFARCIKPTDASLIRDIVDGIPYRSRRANALNFLIQTRSACYPGLEATNPVATITYGNCHPRGHFFPIVDGRHSVIGAETDFAICQAFFDRGAIVEQALKLYAPNLSLTAAELNEPIVVARFRAREAAFDRSRFKQERLYGLVVGCLVEAHPEIALNYLRSAPNSIAQGELQAALIGLGPACLGGATVVEADPSTFRVFVADAIYNWVVAARGISSLVPSP